MSDGPADVGATAPGEARARILARVRAALAEREALPHPGPLDRGERGGASGSVVEAFGEAFRASGGEVVVLEDLEAAHTWLESFARGFGSAAVSPDVPRDLRPDLPEEEPSAAALGVSVAVGAAAATGSLLLSSRPGRALQLLPPTHLVWVDPGSVAGDLDEALGAARGPQGLPAVLALHSGPSKSADIGRIVVTGVHGPGRVVAALVHGLAGEGSGPGR